jgi:glutamate racemase
MFRFMEERAVKALLVACNTISCVVERCSDAVSCPVISAVQAGAEAAANWDAERVGVISTVFTHNSRCYPDRILSLSPQKRVVLSCGCPDLARLVEHNLGSSAGMEEVEANLRLEMDGMVYRDKIQCCVLGCTHYPLVEDSIHKLYPHLPLIDPAEEMARQLRDYLEQTGLRNNSTLPGRLDIYTTGSVKEYAKRAKQVRLDPVTSVSFYPPM